MIRPIIAADGAANIALGVDVDYGDVEPATFIQVGGGSGDPWGGIWDVSWGGALEVVKSWRTAQGFGSAIAPRMRTQTLDVSLSWSASDLVYEHATFGP